MNQFSDIIEDRGKSMTDKIGLKDKKKERRKKRILAAATKLFKNKGFADTTISDIAKSADVGVGTIYNYFSSKNQILLSIVADICIEKKPPETIYENDPVKTLFSYLDSYFDEFTVLDKEIWCDWFAAIFKERNVIEQAFQLDLKIVGELAGLCTKMQERKMITTDVSAQEIAMAVYTAFAAWMTSYFMLPEMDKQSAKQEFERHVNILFRGIRPA
jgi:AcrR family transcriptional regulator